MSKDIFINIRISLPKKTDDEFTKADIKELTQNYKEQFAQQPSLKAKFNIGFVDKLQQLADKLAAKEKESDKLRLLLFAFVRNSRVAAVGYSLKKSEQEITDKTFETIKEAEKILDFAKMQELMNLASDKENRYDRE